MLEGIDVLYHSSIKINKGKVIYIDPFKIDENYSDADIIFITHNHYDHYSPNDINKVRKEATYDSREANPYYAGGDVGNAAGIGLFCPTGASDKRSYHRSFGVPFDGHCAALYAT